jgi:alternate signal-mediated exported protein
MNKTTKGVFAATAAAAILMGGAGSLAYWSDGDTVNGGSFTSGKLTLKALNGANGAPCDSVWKYANGSKAGDTVNNVVPGDQITKTCTFVVGAQGDHLTASPTVPTTVAFTKTPKSGATNTGASLSLPVAATYTLDGAAFGAGSVVTETDNGKTLAAKITVTMPFGSTTVNGNDTQNLTIALNDLTVSLTQSQVAAGANPN